MSKVEEAIVGWFGDRCPEVEETCVVCSVWTEWDALRREAQL